MLDGGPAGSRSDENHSGDGEFGENLVGVLVDDVVYDGTDGSGRNPRVTLEIPPMNVFGELEMEERGMEERGRDGRSNIGINKKGNAVISGEEEFADLNTREEMALRNFGHHQNLT